MLTDFQISLVVPIKYRRFPRRYSPNVSELTEWNWRLSLSFMDRSQREREVLTWVWCSYYTPVFTGLTCLSASSTNSAWWCADVRTALLHTDSTLDTSLWDCVMTVSLLGCQPSTDSSVTSTGYIRWSGVCCRRSVSVQLNCRNVYVTLL